MRGKSLGVIVVVLLGGACFDGTMQTPPPTGGGVNTATGRLLAAVTDGRAFGRGNGTPFVLDPEGVAYLAARTTDASGATGNAILRTQGAWNQARTVNRVFIGDTGAMTVTASPQSAGSLATAVDGSLDFVWTGGSSSHPTDASMARQLRYARLSTTSTLTVTEQVEPLTIDGFDQVYSPPFFVEQLWQENPAAAATTDGALHVVWEARDAAHVEAGVPVPGIAYAVRAPDGSWSTQGLVANAPFLDFATVPDGQFAPVIVAESPTRLHILCEGVVGAVRQIFVGTLTNGEFSGWELVAPSPGFDQRHVRATRDGRGNLHVVWRQQGPDPAALSSIIMYAMRNARGEWGRTQQVSSPVRFSSTPSVAADDTVVRVVWTEWDSWQLNSANQVNNGFPADEGMVEGFLMTSLGPVGGTQFGGQTALVSSGISSYPTFPTGFAGGAVPPVVLWLNGTAAACATANCVKAQVRLVP